VRCLDKYFPDNPKFEKEVEFLKLEQGDMSVYRYSAKFEYLTRFNTQATSEAWRCMKFEEGLKHELKKIVGPICIREFPALVEKAKMVETLEKGDSRVVKTHGSGSSSGKTTLKHPSLIIDPNNKLLWGSCSTLISPKPLWLFGLIKFNLVKISIKTSSLTSFFMSTPNFVQANKIIPKYKII